MAVSSQLHAPATLHRYISSYSLNRRLVGPPDLVRRVWKCRQLMPLLGIEPQLLRHPSRSLVPIPTELSRFPTLADRKGYLNYPKFALCSCCLITSFSGDRTCGWMETRTGRHMKNQINLLHIRWP